MLSGKWQQVGDQPGIQKSGFYPGQSSGLLCDYLFIYFLLVTENYKMKMVTSMYVAISRL